VAEGIDAGKAPYGFLNGDSEMARLILAHDWSGELGPIAGWPASLKTTVGLMLRSPVPLVLLWGPVGTMLYNDAYGGFAGNRHPDLLGKRVLEAWPEAADLNSQVMAVCMDGGTLEFRDERLVLNRRGVPEEGWMDLFYSPVIDESGHPCGVIAVVVETTERVLARRAAVAQSARLAQMFQDAPSFMAQLGGPDHVFTFINAAYQQLIAHRDVIGKPIREALPEIAGQGLYELLDRVYQSGENFRGRALAVTLQRTRGAPPEERLLDFIYQPVRNAAGFVTGIFVEGTDVTESARARAALEENEARLRFLDRLGADIAASQDADAILAITTRLVGEYLGVSICAYADMDADQNGFTIRGDWAAPGAASIVGHYKLADFGRKAVSELSAARPLIINDAESELAPHEAATFQAIGARATLCLPLVKEGRLIALMAIHYNRPHMWTDHELALIHDVTERSWAHIERVRADADLRASNATLERRVEERTSELRRAEDALRQSQKMEAVGQLTGGLAHDFNNLLAGISGSVEVINALLKRGRFDDIERYVAAAQNSTRRAAALTQRLLAFSRRQTLDPRPTDVNRLVAGMEELIRRTVGPTIIVEVVGAGGLWATMIDPPQLESALLNLCINARDAMAPDGGRLTIETANKWLDERGARERDLPPGQYISVCVTDTGCGMTSTVIERAFDPFFTTKPLGEGTGLGLSMVYGFARQSGGQVRIYSEVGRGTTMCLYLPRHLGVTDEAQTPEAAIPAQEGQGETVLVVDDEPVIRMLIRDVLIDSGYTALEAGDGPTALKFLQSNMRIDLLITDVGLPGGINGRQVADAARVSRPQLKVLFITGYAENAVIGNGHLDAGMELLTKPFVVAALGKRIRDMIARSPPATK
jgi:signal transduction histidine kinase/CheY-like chemotaxis protein/PAS domain-containing protein